MINNLFYVLCKQSNISINFKDYYGDKGTLRLSDLKNMYSYYKPDINNPSVGYYLDGLDAMIMKDLNMTVGTDNSIDITQLKLFTGYIGKGGSRKTKKRKAKLSKQSRKTKKQSRK